MASQPFRMYVLCTATAFCWPCASAHDGLGSYVYLVSDYCSFQYDAYDALRVVVFYFSVKFIAMLTPVGGGMHHAFANDGMGWCMFDDVHLAVRRLRSATNETVKQVVDR